MPRPTYLLAMDTTRRRLASDRRDFASSSPSAIFCASTISSSPDSKGTLPISFRYTLTGSSEDMVVSVSSFSMESSLIGSTSVGLSSIPLAWSMENTSSISSAEASQPTTIFSPTSSAERLPRFLPSAMSFSSALATLSLRTISFFSLTSFSLEAVVFSLSLILHLRCFSVSSASA